MRKLLLLLFSLLLSLYTYADGLTSGSWHKVFSYEGTSWWINLEKIQERDGLVFYWHMSSDNKDSSTALTENDCMLTRAKVLQNVQYDKPMMDGEAVYLDTDNDWIYFPPDSVGETLQFIACEMAPLSLDERERDMRAFQKFVKEQEYSEDKQSVTYTDEDLRQAVKFAEERADWVQSVAKKVKINWRYRGADDDWNAEVYVLQARDGTILAVDVRNSSTDEIGFENSIKKAVYKSSPLPKMSDFNFDEEFIFIFQVE